MWQKYWAKSSVDLGSMNTLLESYYYGSQYLIGSASREGKVAPGLFGPFNTNDATGWNGDYTLNYNFQSQYYGVYTENRPNVALPFFDAINSSITLGKQRAQRRPWDQNAWQAGWPSGDGEPGQAQDNYWSTNMPGGYKGIELPGHVGPFGLAGWTDRAQRSNAAFAATTYIDHVEYTQDLDFLSKRAYPFLLLVVDFYQSYMQKVNSSHHEDGYIWSIPSDCSMELCLPTHQLEQNPIVDVALLRRVLAAALSFSKTLKLDEPRRALWLDILTHLPPPLTTIDPVTNATVFAEANYTVGTFGANAWFPLDYFAPLHPGSGISLSSDAETLQTMRNTVEGINRINGWAPESGMQMAWIGAVRVGYNGTDLLLKAKQILSDPNVFYPNFYPITGGGGLEQAGVTLAINEMLMQSHEGYIHLFPVWPKDQAASFEQLRAKGAFVVSAVHDPRLGLQRINSVHIKYDPVNAEAAVAQEEAQLCRVLNPWSENHAPVNVTVVCGGVKSQWEAPQQQLYMAYAPDIIEFSARIGVDCTLAPAGV